MTVNKKTVEHCFVQELSSERVIFKCVCCIFFFLYKDYQSQRMPAGVKDQDRGSIEVLVCISDLGVVCQVRLELFHPVMLMN